MVGYHLKPASPQTGVNHFRRRVSAINKSPGQAANIIQPNMILRVGHSTATETATGHDAWPAFARTQQHAHDFVGCISQPAHAALAARLATALDPGIFGALPPDVIDSIGCHDTGWAEP